MAKKELAIGLPNMARVHIRFALSLATLQLPENTKIVSMERVMIDSARNMIVEKVKDEYERLLFIDSDMVFPPNLYHSLKQENKDIIGALAFKRKAPFEPCVYKKKGEDYYATLPQETSKVDAIGTAGLLINTDVFDKIDFPWFETGYDENGDHWSVDFDFCAKVQEQTDYDIWCKPQAEMKHIGDPKMVGLSEFMEHNDINQGKGTVEHSTIQDDKEKVEKDFVENDEEES